MQNFKLFGEETKKPLGLRREVKNRQIEGFDQDLEKNDL